MNWIIEENTDNRTIEQLSKELNVNKIISSMLVKRGIKTFNQAKDFFRPKINQLHDPFLIVYSVFHFLVAFAVIISFYLKQQLKHGLLLEK
jgi:hypothetical protein